MQNLQIYLMVHALKCQDTIPKTLESYNSFMTKRHDLMVSNKYAVQAHFVRLHGPVDGVAASTSYDTQQGNRLSASAIDVKRCETAGLYARLAAEATNEDLLAMSGMLADGDGLVECPAAAPVPDKPTAMVIPVWKKPAATGSKDASVATVSTASAEGSPAPAPVAAVMTKPAPSASPAVAEMDAAATATDDRQAALKALQDAAAALKQAAVALQPAAPVTAQN